MTQRKRKPDIFEIDAALKDPTLTVTFMPAGTNLRFAVADLSINAYGQIFVFPNGCGVAGDAADDRRLMVKPTDEFQICRR